jgi:Protein of unknown function (DUF664)
MISDDDYLFFVDKALDGMAEIVRGLGDDLANRRPDLPSGNSPYAILTHCLGVIQFWAGRLVAGRTVERDRDAEFFAHGSVDDLLDDLRRVRAQFGADVRNADPLAPLIESPDGDGTPDLLSERQGSAFMHVFEELAQHHGQMEVVRDFRLASSGRSPQP